MQPTKFLNVDLDLHAQSGLTELLEAFGSAIIDMKRENKDCVSIELAKQPQTIDEAILAFSNLVNSLPSEARAIWDKCDLRSMSIGIQAGAPPHSEDFRLSNKTISLLSSMSTEVVITVYSAG